MWLGLRSGSTSSGSKKPIADQDRFHIFSIRHVHCSATLRNKLIDILAKIGESFEMKELGEMLAAS